MTLILLHINCKFKFNVLSKHMDVSWHISSPKSGVQKSIFCTQQAQYSRVLLQRKPSRSSYYKGISNIYKTSKRVYHAESLKDFRLKFSLQKEYSKAMRCVINWRAFRRCYLPTQVNRRKWECCNECVISTSKIKSKAFDYYYKVTFSGRKLLIVLKPRFLWQGKKFRLWYPDVVMVCVCLK